MGAGAKQLKDVVVGDKVIRNMGGIKMPLKVTDVTDEFIICGGHRDDGHEWWWFDKATGAEVDDDLGWGPSPKYDHTGSFIYLAL